MKSLFKRNNLQIALIYALVTGTGITIFDYLLAESSQSACAQSLMETFITWTFVTAFSLGLFFISHEELLRGPIIENELSLGQDELQTVLRCLPVMLLSVDRKGKIIFAEGQGVKQAGVERGELIGQLASRFYELFVTDRQHDKAIPWNKLMERVFAGETVVASTKWNGRHYENRFSATQNHSADVNGIVWMVIDVTEHKRGEEVLLNTAKRYERLSESFPNGTVTIFDRDLRILFVAGSELKESGLPAESFLGKTFQEVAPAETFEIAQPHLLAAFEGSSGSYETSYWNNRYYLVNVVPLADDDGSIQQIMLVTQNITNRNHLEENLRKAELRYRTLVEQIPPIIYTAALDQHVGVTYISPRIQTLGFTQEEWVADPELWFRQIHPEDRERISRELDEIHRTGQGHKMEYRILTREGDVRWFLDDTLEVFDPEGQFLFRQGIMLDITSSKQAEELLRLQRDRLAELSRQLVTVRENEQRAIGRELHDQIGQMLTALRITLETLPHLPPETATRKITRAREVTDELLDRVSSLSLKLRPSMLDDQGLLPALLWHIRHYQEQSGLQVMFKHRGLREKRFDPDIETAIYRVVQESLTNVARHARATLIQVDIEVDSDQFTVQIRDNGQGFDPVGALKKNRGLGGMRERVVLLHGKLWIESKPGSGTYISLRLPIGKPLRD